MMKALKKRDLQLTKEEFESPSTCEAIFFCLLRFYWLKLIAFMPRMRHTPKAISALLVLTQKDLRHIQPLRVSY